MKGLLGELKARVEEYKRMTTLLRQELSSSELSSLDVAIQRLENLRIVVSAFGETNSGKSALLNALVQKNNQDYNSQFFSVSPDINKWDDEIERNNRKFWKELEGFEIILQDTPGIAGDNPEHLQKAKKFAEGSDVILYVIWPAIKGKEVLVMQELLSTKQPLIFVINKTDIQEEDQIEALKADLYRKIPNLSDEMIVMAAGKPMRKAPPITSDLENKIFSIVTREPETLISETLQRLGNKAAEVAAIRIRQRAEEEKRKQDQLVRDKEEKISKLTTEAEGIITGYSIAASAVAGLVPFGLDFITSTLISSGMFFHIASLYDKEQDLGDVSSIAKELSSELFSLLFVSAAALTTFLTISKGAKTNPFTYIIGLALDAAFTYFVVSSIGNTFSYYCANNLSWGVKKNASEVLREYIRKNIFELFIDKLPSRFREQILKLINPDLLR